MFLEYIFASETAVSQNPTYQHAAISAATPLSGSSEVNQKTYVTSLHIRPRNATLKHQPQCNAAVQKEHATHT